jgi:hypothetical protein
MGTESAKYRSAVKTVVRAVFIGHGGTFISSMDRLPRKFSPKRKPAMSGNSNVLK